MSVDVELWAYEIMINGDIYLKHENIKLLHNDGPAII